MLSWIRWQWSKWRFAFRTGSAPNIASRLLTNYEKVEKYAPNALPYEKLSEHWNDLAPLMGYRYASFLPKLEDRYQVTLGSVLDIACGTGVDARAMAKAGRTVMGLDVSSSMIAHARETSSETSVEYAQADMRDFSLGRTFTAVTCGGNALNYVETPDQIVDVMRCVARHLEPGGFFLVDANDGNCFWWSGVYTSVFEFAGHRVDR